MGQETGTDALLRQLLTCQKKTLGQTRLAAAFTVLLAVLLLVVLTALALLVPRTLALEKQVKTSLSRMEEIAEPAEAVIKSVEALLPEDGGTLQESLQKIGGLDLDGLSETLKKLDGMDLDSLNEAIQKLNGIDLDSLNEAIVNLNDAVRPLAELARRLNGD